MARARTPDAENGAGAGNAAGKPARGRFEQLRRRLRWKLLAAYVTPLLLLAAYFHFQYHATLREGIDNHLRSAAENQRNTVDLFLQERVANVKNVLRAMPSPPSPAPDAMEEVLRSLRRRSPTFVDVGLFDPRGTLVSYAGEFDFLLGKDYRGEAWYQDLVREHREHLISDVFLGFRRRPHFIIAVERPEEEEPWVLRASVDPVRFSEFVRETHLAAEAESFIVNATGERQTISAEENGAQPFPVPASPSREAQVLEVGWGGTDYVCAYSWLTETSWAVVVRVPADRAYAPLRHARLTLTAIMVAALLGIVVLVVRSTRSIVRQLQEADEVKQDLRRQLHSAGKLASVGEMAAGIAHEINNPLAVIHEEAGMMLDLLDLGRDVEKAELRDRLQAITGATMRGRGITSKLLAFARQGDPSPKPTDLHALIDRVLSMKEVEFKVGNIEVVRAYAPDVPTLHVNPNELEQVLLNLLNNSRDAMSGPGRIRIATERRGDEVRIEVEDDGCGMTEEQMERIFFPFYTTKDVGKGTGLGLSISYGIIETMGGRIEVRSQPGVGSAFTVVLPASTGSTPAAMRGTHV